MSERGMAVSPGYVALLLRGGIDDVHDAAADQAFAGSLGHVDPGVRAGIDFDVPVARIRRRRAIVLAGLDDAGALLLVAVVVSSHDARRERGAGQREHARDGETNGRGVLAH